MITNSAFQKLSCYKNSLSNLFLSKTPSSTSSTQLQASFVLFNAANNNKTLSIIYKTALVVSLVFPLFVLLDLTVLNLLRFGIGDRYRVFEKKYLDILQKKEISQKWSVLHVFISATLVGTLVSFIVYKTIQQSQKTASTNSNFPPFFPIGIVAILFLAITIPISIKSSREKLLFNLGLHKLFSPEPKVSDIKPVDRRSLEETKNDDKKSVDSKPLKEKKNEELDNYLKDIENSISLFDLFLRKKKFFCRQQLPLPKSEIATLDRVFEEKLKGFEGQIVSKYSSLISACNDREKFLEIKNDLTNFLTIFNKYDSCGGKSNKLDKLELLRYVTLIEKAKELAESFFNDYSNQISKCTDEKSLHKIEEDLQKFSSLEFKCNHLHSDGREDLEEVSKVFEKQRDGLREKINQKKVGFWGKTFDEVLKETNPDLHRLEIISQYYQCDPYPDLEEKRKIFDDFEEEKIKSINEGLINNVGQCVKLGELKKFKEFFDKEYCNRLFLKVQWKIEDKAEALGARDFYLKSVPECTNLNELYAMEKEIKGYDLIREDSSFIVVANFSSTMKKLISEMKSKLLLAHFDKCEQLIRYNKQSEEIVSLYREFIVNINKFPFQEIDPKFFNQAIDLKNKFMKILGKESSLPIANNTYHLI
jgi:hypothetical protein